MALGNPVINSTLSGYVRGTCPVVNCHTINGYVWGDPTINSTVSEVIYDLVINSSLLGYMGGTTPVINSTLSMAMSQSTLSSTTHLTLLCDLWEIL